MDVISLDSWQRVWAHALALYPRWESNEEQEALWRQRLEVYTEHRLMRAIDDVVSEHPVLTPRLAWVVSKLRGSLSDAPNVGAELRNFPSTPEQAEQAEAVIISHLRETPPAPNEVRAGMRRWLFWKSGEWPKSYHIDALSKAATPKPYEIWPHGLVGLVWAAQQVAAKEEEQQSFAVKVEYEDEPGAIEVDDDVDADDSDPDVPCDDDDEENEETEYEDVEKEERELPV